MCYTRIDKSGKESIEYPKEKTSEGMSKKKRDHRTAGKHAIIERLSNKNKEPRPALRRQRPISVKSASLVNTVSSRPTRATSCISGCGYTCPESQQVGGKGKKIARSSRTAKNRQRNTVLKNKTNRTQNYLSHQCANWQTATQKPLKGKSAPELGKCRTKNSSLLVKMIDDFRDTNM